ncbi:MAG: fumarate hydratase C-terminal domain-containing protein [Coriobacteriales bacterium]|jgi:fumarate hydratase class I/fumarate hydratase subunit beta|nr:fumarate hydratase C-terminal domain-containing protein [Coriobacteriales bacterium]
MQTKSDKECVAQSTYDHLYQTQDKQSERAVHHISLPATTDELLALRAGDEVLLSGKIFTMRDAGHARALQYLQENGELPYGLAGQAVFYAGPTEERTDIKNAPFAAIGPTTASRMDFAAPQLMQAGINVMLGKGQRSQDVKLACEHTSSVYLVATGGAAALLATHVIDSTTVAWDDLGTEALRCLTICNLPCFCGFDTYGGDIYGGDIYD